MKLGPVTELDKINTVPSRNFTMVSCQEIVTSMSNLWQICSQSRGWIYKTGVIMVYLLTITFYLMKTENKTTKPQTQL